MIRTGERGYSIGGSYHQLVSSQPCAPRSPVIRVAEALRFIPFTGRQRSDIPLLNLLIRPIQGSKETFQSIDLLRGLSAIAILVFHFHHFLMGGGAMNIASNRDREVGILNALSLLRDWGALAVMLFWMISGFVFMNVYAAGKPKFYTFLVNRISRLYPIHIITLLVVAALQIAAMNFFGHFLIYQINDAFHFVLNIFFASEWGFERGNSFNGPIWSVSVEVLIYAVFYIYIRYFRVNLITSSASFFVFLAFAKVWPKNMIFLCGVFFFAGMIVYAIYSLIPRRLRLRAAVFSLICMLGACAVGLAVGPRLPLPLTLWLIPIFGFALLALAMSEMLGLAPFYHRLRAVGDLTYSTYLWHSPLQMVFLLGAGLGLWNLNIVLTNAFFIGYLIVVIVFSYGSFHLIERPAQRWIRASFLHSTRPINVISAP